MRYEAVSEYSGAVNGIDSNITVEREGLRHSGGFVDFSAIKALRPVSHKVYIERSNTTEEIGMLGFSYDGFWEELLGAFGDRSLEALFTEENPIMKCEGEFSFSGESGRALIMLFSDSVCILPQTENARRIPLCFTENIDIDGYIMHLTLDTGEEYSVGKMGYDTKPFFERTQSAAKKIRETRKEKLAALTQKPPFEKILLLRTQSTDYLGTIVKNGRCAVELFTDEDTATYLYSFDESEDVFLKKLSHAMEAMGKKREIIFLPEEKITENPLYKMAVVRTPAVSFLRSRCTGRLVHSSRWEEKLLEFIG